MKFNTFKILGALPALALVGCVVAPPPPMAPYAPPAPVYVQPQGQVMMPAAPVYVEPTYPMPGVGFVWEFHPRHGWGWHHPQYGWHKGWR